MNIFEDIESEVRSYCRAFPTTFEKAKGCYMFDQEGNRYLDFFAGAGALNYGHNPTAMKARLLEYLMEDNVTHGLDMSTVAKGVFLQKFKDTILTPRNMSYKVQFPGPTGTNAVESALKLARKVTGREKMLFFTQAFHGMTLGSLSISGNQFKREGAGLPLTNTICMPYDGYFGDEVDTIEYMDRMLESSGSGVDLPAAAIVETVQAEGGINVASAEWLEKLQALCKKYNMLFIVDDIQAGCGRTGTFFSFEKMNIQPDIICLSKSISGYGLPMALCLIKPEHDIWEPGEHNGTFRGNNLAFVTATEALKYWENDDFSNEILRKGAIIQEYLNDLKDAYPDEIREIRGRGFIYGIVFNVEGNGPLLSKACFENNLLAETSGADSDVFKLLPPLVISEEELRKGLNILGECIGITQGKALA
ncbi:MAG: diaminobutyrate--2-oxoglutarate transaminase [Candidatus Nitrohelix vancouverensis]|uniref:Diaminobutyrate--2-oxoglutarate transaminase n=1 Tax=Candidatus Nitrohelix vancouverensis TaxID=2705534 RepID=A0A7T0G2I1_9BACT|nr:MAG: diaminobutyrate--2-oxoglutarate transaminase [Candidatus Nitrohelix vancouverensis]